MYLEKNKQKLSVALFSKVDIVPTFKGYIRMLIVRMLFFQRLRVFWRTHLGLVSHHVCQPHCFSAPSMWQQASIRLAGWQGIRTVTGASDKEHRHVAREAEDGTGAWRLRLSPS